MTLLQFLLPLATLVLGSGGTLLTQWFTARWTVKAARRSEWDAIQRETILETQELVQALWTMALTQDCDEDDPQVLSVYSQGQLKAHRIDDAAVREAAHHGLVMTMGYLEGGRAEPEAVRDDLDGVHRVLGEKARELGRPA